MLSKDEKQEFIGALELMDHPYFDSNEKIFSDAEEEELKGLSDGLLIKLGNTGYLLKHFLPKRPPHMKLRIQSLWIMFGWIMFGFFLFWLSWKLSGYAILHPSWAMVGVFGGLCFFIKSFLLKRVDQKLREDLSDPKLTWYINWKLENWKRKTKRREKMKMKRR